MTIDNDCYRLMRAIGNVLRKKPFFFTFYILDAFDENVDSVNRCLHLNCKITFVMRVSNDLKVN